MVYNHMLGGVGGRWMCYEININNMYLDIFVHSFTHSFIHSPIRSSIHPSIHSFVRSFTHSSIHSFVHSYKHILCVGLEIRVSIIISDCAEGVDQLGHVDLIHQPDERMKNSDFIQRYRGKT